MDLSKKWSAEKADLTLSLFFKVVFWGNFYFTIVVPSAMVWVTNTSTVVLNFGSILTRPIPFPEKKNNKSNLHIAFHCWYIEPRNREKSLRLI